MVPLHVHRKESQLEVWLLEEGVSLLLSFALQSGMHTCSKGKESAVEVYKSSVPLLASPHSKVMP